MLKRSKHRMNPPSWASPMLPATYTVFRWKKRTLFGQFVRNPLVHNPKDGVIGWVIIDNHRIAYQWSAKSDCWKLVETGRKTIPVEFNNEIRLVSVVDAHAG